MKNLGSTLTKSQGRGGSIGAPKLILQYLKSPEYICVLSDFVSNCGEQVDICRVEQLLVGAEGEREIGIKML